MAMPQFTIRDMLEAGVHFGHRTHRWNPKMQDFIFGDRNGIHIMDLQQTVPLMFRAMGLVRTTVANGGRVMFVGTKRQAQDIVAEAAQRSGMFYMNHRWMGGTLTNWKTVSNSIRRMLELEEMFTNKEETMSHRTKKEQLMMEREYTKLKRALGGVDKMGGIPDVVVVMDVNKDRIAVEEANCLGIPVIGILDSNSNPDGIDFPIPGNDDSTRALKLYTRLLSDAILDGISQQMSSMGKAKMGGEPKGGRKATVKLSPKAAKAAEKTEEAPVAEAAKTTEKSETAATAS